MRFINSNLAGKPLLPVVIFGAVLLFAACSGQQGETPESMTERIDLLLSEKRFDDAFELLHNASEAPMVNGAAYDTDVAAASADQQAESAGYGSHTHEATLHGLLVNTHLAYASYLTHEADHLAMGQRMGDALRHFRRAAELDPQNSIALTHIELIEGIYAQMGRDVPEGVAK